MCALIGFWRELAILVPGHEKDKVLPLAEENSDFFFSDCRSFGPFVTVIILMFF